MMLKLFPQRETVSVEKSAERKINILSVKGLENVMDLLVFGAKAQLILSKERLLHSELTKACELVRSQGYGRKRK